MGFSLWFLKLALKCIDHLSWPLLALGYPLCASVKAIETDSYPETKDLISYWILLSLIYLFEYTFLKLLQWFWFWPYIKLMIVFWLIVPDFGRASYVYNHLINLCISVKPQAVISGLKNWKKLAVGKDNFLLQAEIYIKENGTEGLDKLIASKTDGKRLETECKDIKDLEVVEKKEVPAGKQDNPSMRNLVPSQNTSSAMAGKDPDGGEHPQSSRHMKVQKEWTCAICQVTTQSKITLNSHLHGSKHRATCEALKAKNQPISPNYVPASMSRTNNLSKDELKQKNILDQHVNKEQNNIQISNAKEHAKRRRKRSKKCMLNDAVNETPIKDQKNRSTGDQKGVPAPANKSDQLNAGTNNGESIFNKGKIVIDHEKVKQELQKNLGKPLRMSRSKLICQICNVSCSSEGNMASHLNGKKHLAQIQALSEAYIK